MYIEDKLGHCCYESLQDKKSLQDIIQIKN